MGIAVGESKCFDVEASNPANDTGIELDAGGVYNLSATGLWRDATIERGPNGYTVEELGTLQGLPHRLFGWLRRDTNQPWFKLMGEFPLGSGRLFPIGTMREGFRPSETGVLGALANDIPAMYGNNHGTVRLEVTRTG